MADSGVFQEVNGALLAIFRAFSSKKCIPNNGSPLPGGASSAIGATGYVVCAKESRQQLFEQNLSIDHLVDPSGCAGTHAETVVGM